MVYLSKITQAPRMLDQRFSRRCHNKLRLEEITEYPHYDVSGSHHKKTILLLHGITVTRKMWIP